ncbi:MAG: AAA family ATPase [Desulfobacterales bacterium]|jgi:general secretion pathway protein A
MEYFSIVNLEREPFSNSPDPEFFYGSHQHLECLQKLELALRLRRGLNVIIGDVGTGKTTLCRQLIRRFAKTKEFETHLVLDPGFSSTAEFLVTIIEMLTGRRPPEEARDWQMKEMVKNHLFKRGVDEKKTVALIIDEGQKLPGFCLELLREFLNYETNEYKLLQIVIFAQTEFQNTIDNYANFADRINLYHHLKPMSFGDTRAMIRFRLEKSSTNFKDYTYFSLPALIAIYIASRGYPRKIINLCHRCILTMIIQSRPSVDLFLARTCIRRVFPHRSRRIKRLALSVGIPLLLLAIGIAAMDIRHLRLSAQTGSSLTDPQPGRSSANYRKIEVVPEPLSAPTTPQSAAAVLPPPPAPVSLPAAPPQPVVPGTAPENADLATTLPSPVPPPVTKPPQVEAPHELGQITIMPNENLYELIETIYGDVSSLLFESLLLANPFITDPNLVQVGQMVRVPAIPADVRPLADPVWWISVAHRRSLEDAYIYLRSLTGNARQVRIVSYWTPQNGIQFDLLLDRIFPDPLTARIALEQLPVPLSKEGRIVSIWSPETVFYTDPFFRHQNRRANS